MALPSGMAENPGESYSLSSRFICDKCGAEPTILNPEKIVGSSFNITVQCHGEKETIFLEKKNLTLTHHFFSEEKEDASND